MINLDDVLVGNVKFKEPVSKFIKKRDIGFNPFESEVDCIDPRIILNPRLPELIHRYGAYVMKGTFFRFQVDYFTSLGSFPYYRFNPALMDIKVSDIPHCYVVDMSSGDIFPIYFLVPCGHCIICSNSKAGSFARRCQYESQLYDCDPVHLTLTYRDEFLPPNGDVSLRDVVLFKKAFRIHLQRMGYFLVDNGRIVCPKLRIALAAEYGKKHARPHYHLIIWNLKPFGSFWTYRMFRNVAWISWSRNGVPMCDWSRLTLSPINDSYIPKGCTKSLGEMGKTSVQAFGYVAKYFYKQHSAPRGHAPVFHTFSKDKFLGGIGAPFVMKHAPDMRKHLRKEFLYLDRRSDKTYSVPYDRFLLNKVFPSRYTSVSYKIRRDLRFCCQYVARLGDVELLLKLRYQINRFSRAFYFQVVDNCLSNVYCFKADVNCPLIGFLIRCKSYFSGLLERISGYEVDFDEVLYLDSLRKKMLDKLYVSRKTYNVNAIAHDLEARHARRISQYTHL